MLRAIQSAFLGAGRGLLDLLYPASCLGCGGLPEGEDQHLCPDCAQRIVPIAPPVCATCGLPTPPEADPGLALCLGCRELVPAWQSGLAMYEFGGLGRDFVHRFKYEHGTYLRGDLVTLCQRHPYLQEHVGGAELIPVPLHPRRLAWRGFNQSLLFAEAVAATVGYCRVTPLLERTRDTAAQAQLPRKRRAANVAGAFRLRPDAQPDARARYVLVDDVFTTGSTLNACAKVLRQAGLHRIDVLTLVHASARP